MPKLKIIHHWASGKEPISVVQVYKGLDRFGAPICVDYENERENGLEWQDRHT